MNWIWLFDLPGKQLLASISNIPLRPQEIRDRDESLSM
ncbi:hypothetical protein NIES2104_45040 [Leptolyngbya sp. NIES-2104]|nr:hypothetical protein NIES2104_45040 [Leptolyngbya sp. NIES-2104]